MICPERLIDLLTSLSAAADIVDAIRDSSLQACRGWNLTRWDYEPMPWGMRFLHRDRNGHVDREVRAVAGVAAQTPNSISDVAITLRQRTTTVVNLI
jgi:hypothetical protein